MWVSTPKYSHKTLTLWPVFQDGSLTAITPASSPKGAFLDPGGPHDTPGYNSPPEGGDTFPGPLSGRPNRCGPDRGRVHRPEGRLIARGRVWSQALPFQQFHVLFDSLSKVLFIFRSRYLCAIGLRRVFSFRWNLPPIWSCIPKQLDSLKGPRAGTRRPGHVRDSHPP